MSVIVNEVLWLDNGIRYMWKSKDKVEICRKLEDIPFKEYTVVPLKKKEGLMATKKKAAVKKKAVAKKKPVVKKATVQKRVTLVGRAKQLVREQKLSDAKIIEILKKEFPDSKRRFEYEPRWQRLVAKKEGLNLFEIDAKGKPIKK